MSLAKDLIRDLDIGKRFFWCQECGIEYADIIAIVDAAIERCAKVCDCDFPSGMEAKMTTVYLKRSILDLKHNRTEQK